MKVSVYANRYVKNVKVEYNDKNYKVKRPPLDTTSDSESQSESSSVSHSASHSTSQSFFIKNGEPLPVCFNWSGVQTGGLVDASNELAHYIRRDQLCGAHPNTH